MKVAFRVDASAEIGSGHLMRCLTLAKRFIKEKNADVYFIMRELDGNLIKIVEQEGFYTIILPKTDNDYCLKGYTKWLTVPQVLDAKQSINRLELIGPVDLLVVDSYAIDITWECLLRPYTKKIMVIDDLANLYDDMEGRYNDLVSRNCKRFCGPKYALLREEFYNIKKTLQRTSLELCNILVFFGGVDATNETLKTLLAIEQIDNKKLIINVVVGENNPNKVQIREYCSKHPNWNYHCQISNIAELMAEADLALGAAGTTTWERCFLELPTVVIAVAENQVEGAKACCKAGIIKYIGESQNVSIESIVQSIDMLSSNEIEFMRKRCNYLMGDGGKFYELLEACCNF